MNTALLKLGVALREAGYAFTAISPPSHRRVNDREGNELARDLRGVFGWNRPFAQGLLAPHIMALMREAGILDAHALGYKSALRAATLDGKLFFHSGFPTSQSDAVFFGPDTYRYGQLLQTGIDDETRLRARRAVDIGCGAGPGAVLLAQYLPHAEVWGVDINPKALALAAVNAELAGAGQVRLAHSDLLRGLAGQFDVIAANPPFMLDTDQRTYCHGGGELGEGLSLAIVASAVERLAAGGTLLLYTCVAIVDGRDPFYSRLQQLLPAARFNWHYREIDPDVFGGELGREAHARASTERIAAVALQATSRPHLPEQGHS
ncbi:methyltransferase [Janthinobacterium aquaticum]|uniref:methyltransferase n=1 Tax=Janthinobacterium sp. FT58W TaxID=2654254 RepID=UPI001265385E|nr:methyltransferase [Janthinobacterium sp. FT58W]KAB8044257.1 methyltransferase [Janthinobacterium sp. FT58W]